MKIITEDFQVEFAPDEREVGMALAILETIRQPNSEEVVLLDRPVIDLLAEMVADGQLTVNNGNGDTSAYVEQPIEKQPIEPLTPKQQATLNWLIKHDKNEGVSVSEVAQALKVDQRAMNARLSTLTKLGCAERVSRGRYRAITPNG